MALSPPPGILKTNSETCLDKTRVDNILGRSSPRPKAFVRCFDLSGPYRTNPRYAHRDSNRSPLVPPLPLVKSHSMPELGDLPSTLPCTFAATGSGGAHDELQAVWDAQQESVMSEGAEQVQFKRTVWQCANTQCGNHDMALLETNSDSELVCTCGFVAHGVRQVAIPRFKMCEDSKERPDPSRVADDAMHHTAEEAKYAAMLGGPESREDARRRQQLYQGGTRMNTKRLQKNGLLKAQNCIDAQTRRDNSMEALHAPDGRVKAVIVQMEKIFDQMPSLKDTTKGIGRYIRAEGMRIGTLAWRHERECSSPACIYSLSGKTAMGVAHAIVELVLTSLLDDEELVAVQSGGEMTKQHIEQAMKEFTTFQIRFSQGMPRIQLLSTVGLISEWEFGEEHWRSCGAVEPVAPLRLPASLASCPEYGRVGARDPGDVTLKLRNSLWGAARSGTVRTDVRMEAMEQLAVEEVVAFATESNLPVELIAVCTLSATAARMGLDNPVATLGSNLSARHQIATSTLATFTEQLAPLLKIAVPPPHDANPNNEAAAGRFCN
jgi:hypothetical protein